MPWITNPWTTNPWTTNPWTTNPWMTYCSPIDAKPTAGQTLTLKLSLPAEKTVTIDWGDGNTTNVIGPASGIDYANTYADAGTYPIRMSGDFQNLTRFEIKDVEVDGTTKRLGALSGLMTFVCKGNNTLSGDMANLPASLTTFNCGGNNTLSGDIANLPTGLTYFSCGGRNTISNYTTPHTWTTKPAAFQLKPVAPGGLSTAEIDQLLIDFDDDLAWSSGNAIELTGANAARSSASDAAVSNMVAEECSVTTN